MATLVPCCRPALVFLMLLTCSAAAERTLRGALASELVARGAIPFPPAPDASRADPAAGTDSQPMEEIEDAPPIPPPTMLHGFPGNGARPATAGLLGVELTASRRARGQLWLPLTSGTQSGLHVAPEDAFSIVMHYEARALRMAGSGAGGRDHVLSLFLSSQRVDAEQLTAGTPAAKQIGASPHRVAGMRVDVTVPARDAAEEAEGAAPAPASTPVLNQAAGAKAGDCLPGAVIITLIDDTTNMQLDKVCVAGAMSDVLTSGREILLAMTYVPVSRGRGDVHSRMAAATGGARIPAHGPLPCAATKAAGVTACTLAALRRSEMGVGLQGLHRAGVRRVGPAPTDKASEQQMASQEGAVTDAVLVLEMLDLADAVYDVTAFHVEGGASMAGGLQVTDGAGTGEANEGAGAAPLARLVGIAARTAAQPVQQVVSLMRVSASGNEMPVTVF